MYIYVCGGYELKLGNKIIYRKHVLKFVVKKDYSTVS